MNKHIFYSSQIYTIDLRHKSLEIDAVSPLFGQRIAFSFVETTFVLLQRF